MSDYGVITAPRTVRLERVLPGPIERVWSYLVDSERRGEWLATGPLEPRVGGKVELHFHHATLTPHREDVPEKYREFDNSVVLGEVRQWQPPRLLAFTWPEGANRTSEVTFELEPEGTNVRLIITHRNLGSREEMVSVSGGWHVHSGILVDKLNGRVPQPFWAEHARVEREYERRYPAL